MSATSLTSEDTGRGQHCAVPVLLVHFVGHGMSPESLGLSWRLSGTYWRTSGSLPHALWALTPNFSDSGLVRRVSWCGFVHSPHLSHHVLRLRFGVRCFTVVCVCRSKNREPRLLESVEGGTRKNSNWELHWDFALYGAVAVIRRDKKEWILSALNLSDALSLDLFTVTLCQLQTLCSNTRVSISARGTRIRYAGSQR